MKEPQVEHDLDQELTQLTRDVYRSLVNKGQPLDREVRQVIDRQFWDLCETS